MNNPAFHKLSHEVVKVKCRILAIFFALCLLIVPVSAEGDYIHWVDFNCSMEAMEKALSLDVQSFEEEQHLSWISLLALAAVYTGGVPTPDAVNRAAKVFAGEGPEAALGENYKTYRYYEQAYTAALGGLVGSYAVELEDENGNRYWQPSYGLKAFSPIAAGYGYSHCDDFGVGRSYGFRRKHLGNDLMGGLGTPIVAVESGTVEAMGWNQYGGWRVGIRSRDGQRYWYYAHLRRGHPFAAGITEGAEVEAGQVIGYVGMTGYSTTPDTNGMSAPHLHFGLQLIFDESQKEGNNEIWVDVYPLVNLLERRRATVVPGEEKGEYRRKYRFTPVD